VYPTKLVNIIPKITGVPSAGFNVTNVTVSPNKIKIAAPQDVLNKISELELEVLDVTGVNKNVVLTKQILNTDGLFIIDLQSQPVVTAFVEKTIEKDLIYNFSEINFTNLKTGLEIINNIDNKTIITAKIIGSESVINKFTKDDLIINADLSNATSGVNQVVLKSESKKEVDKIYLNINTIAVEIKNLINEEQTDIQ
jgi:YbbR domain-containing protein